MFEEYGFGVCSQVLAITLGLSCCWFLLFYRPYGFVSMEQRLRIANIHRYSSGIVLGQILVIRRTCGAKFKVVVCDENLESMAFWLQLGFESFPFVIGETVAIRVNRNSLHREPFYCRAFTTMFVADVCVGDFSRVPKIEIRLPNFVNPTASKLSFYGKIVEILNIEPTGSTEATGVVQNTQLVRVQVANMSVLCQLWNVEASEVDVGDTLMAYVVRTQYNGTRPLLYIPYVRKVHKSFGNLLSKSLKTMFSQICQCF